MTIEEYFGDWMIAVDKTEANKVMGFLKTIKPDLLCPALSNVFKAFKLCSFKDLKIVMIGQDPYPDKYMGKPRATGILFGNNKDIPDDKLSPSLEIIKESAINFEVPHNFINFDVTLESWARQGILMINSALTCEFGKVGSHVNQWRPFMTKLIGNISLNATGIIYVLFGRQAQTLRPYINEKFNDIIEIEHPSYFARTKQKMPYSVFTEMNDIMYGKYGYKITLFNEE